MGGKRAGKRQHILFYTACFIIVALGSGCSHYQMSLRAKEHLANARNLIAMQRYDEAIKESEHVLELSPKAKEDQALFLMGVIYGHPKNPSPDLERSIKCFESLRELYPESDLIPPSELYISILGRIKDLDEEILELKKSNTARQSEINGLRTQLHNLKNNLKDDEIKRLQIQLEDLKKIDLGIEEDKRKTLPR
jgi:tetratricopeptide (TPR) repeat protein